MIEITRLNNTQILINCDLIECIEERPDTTITMINGKKYIVKEDVSEIVDLVIDFKRKCNAR